MRCLYIQYWFHDAEAGSYIISSLYIYFFHIIVHWARDQILELHRMIEYKTAEQAKKETQAIQYLIITVSKMWTSLPNRQKMSRSLLTITHLCMDGI